MIDLENRFKYELNLITGLNLVHLQPWNKDKYINQCKQAVNSLQGLFNQVNYTSSFRDELTPLDCFNETSQSFEGALFIIHSIIKELNDLIDSYIDSNQPLDLFLNAQIKAYINALIDKIQLCFNLEY